MTSDRELLELAAKAAGVEYIQGESEKSKENELRFGFWLKFPYGYEVPEGVRRRWNPLTDNGDALRLAVKLGLVVDVGPVSVSVHKNNGNRDLGFEFYSTGKDDPYAATRRAIVRAAAEIGRTMI